MDIQETLTAYLEGTLSQPERLRVAKQLSSSQRWQAEMDRLKDMRHQLSNEMPLIGRSSQSQLAALLPGILETSKSNHQEIDWAIATKQVMLVIAIVMTMVIAPMFLMRLNNSARAAANLIENVPRVTSTPMVNLESTVESDVDLLIMLRAYSVINQVPISQQSEQSAYMAASPAPMPGATVEPSLEARVERP